MKHKFAYERQLGVEAVVVGVASIPVFLATEQVVKLFRASDFTTKVWTIFLSGAYFHLIAEGTGVNKWYLENSAASMKETMRPELRANLRGGDRPVHECDGRCGWFETQGLFPHEIFHP